MSEVAAYKAEREVRTYVDLLHGAKVLFSKSEENTEGAFYTTMGALLLSAFTFEAYLNHVGNSVIPFWAEIDSIRVMDKFAVLCKQLKINPDKSKRPFQTLIPLFKFRNSIAHGRSQILTESKMMPKETDIKKEFPQTTWEEFCTLDNSRRAIEDVEEILEQVHAASGLEYHVFMSGSGVASLTYNEVQQGAQADRPASGGPAA